MSWRQWGGFMRAFVLLYAAFLLIGVFWTKIGTRTEHYESGTIEEIEEHIKLGKPAMIYFSKEKVKLESIDQNQYEKLKEYKRSCTDRSIYREYNDKNEFRDRLYEHLQITINEHEDFTQEEIWDKITITTPKETSKEILSEEAKELLLEAAKDRNGYILHLKYMGGESIQTHGKQFVETDDPREIAKWESALDVLEANDLIRAQGYKRESFKITDKGYKLADLLSNNEN